MKFIFYLTLLLLIYNNDGFITNYKNKEFIYKFSNNIIASNKASDKVLSQWTYSGILIVQEYDDCKIFKLDDIKTSFFNGQRNNINVNETKLPNDKKILTEPFGVYFNTLTDVNITVTPNDELWSINMKKSIASNFLIDTSINNGKTDTEKLIFGKCGINLEVRNSGATKIIEKTINHKTCNRTPIKQWSNVDWLKNNHSSFQHETKRIYVVSKNNCVFSIDSSSNFTLQSSPDVRSTNRIEQNQYFELIATKQNTKPLKIHNNTIIKNLIYEDQIMTKTSTNQEKYLENFVDAYTKFKLQINQKPLRFLEITGKTPLAEMLTNLKKFDDNCLRKLLVGILMGRDQQYYEIFLEVLPYAGTKQTTNLIKEIIKDEVNLHTKIKLLTTFTEYIEEINDETVKNFEDLLTFGFDEIPVKHAAVLSFTSLISKGIERNTINDSIVEKYVKKFYDNFLNSQKHEDKIIYLLSLVNISKKVPLNAILNIIYNQRESRHIRELAMYSFKNRLKPFGEELFYKFWPIVKNLNDHFETRLAALDLLLSCDITEVQFNEIVNFYDRELDNPYDEHLSNYVVTTIISLQNNTGYHHYLGDWATKIFQTKKLRQNLKVWTTGNYRFSFTDENLNFGLAMQTKLVSDPKTNTINVIQFNLEQFAMSMNLGDLHIYLKLEGLLDLMFLKTFWTERSNKTPVNELINLIQQCKYQLKHREDLFIDVVVFNGDRALFSLHMNHNNSNPHHTSWEPMIKFLSNYKSVSYPILNEIKIPSDLGTELEIKYEMQNVEMRELTNILGLIETTTAPISINKKLLTQMTETIISHNPLTDVKIYVEKLSYDFKTLELPLTINISEYSISWNNKNDMFNWIKQNKIYTFVSNKTALKQNCLSCNEFEEIPTGESKAECIEAEKHLNQCQMDYSIWRERLITKHPLGLTINLTSTKESEEMEELQKMNKNGVHLLTEIIDSHRGNALTFPFVKPILYFSHLILYKRYLDNDLNEFSVRNMLTYDADDAYTTKIKLFFDENSGKKLYPINEFDEKFSIEILNVRNKNNYVLSGVTFHLTSNISKTNIDQIESNFAITADILDWDVKKKFCLNHKMVYPKKSIDLLSLEPVKPAEGVTTISLDKVESFEDCPHYFLKITDVLSTNNEHNEIIKKSNEYKTCKTESVGFKYIPPTKSCKIAHKAVSLYRDYVVYAETYHAGIQEDNNIKNKIFEYHHVNDKTINVSVSRDFVHLLEIDPKPEFLNYEESSTFTDYLSAEPTEFVTNSERTCDISADVIKTFFDRIISDVNPQQKYRIAFVENTNASQVGLVFGKIGKINVGFLYWSGQNKISTSIENGQMKIYLNEKEVTENTQNDELKINFIHSDVVFISSDFVELYYTPNSLSIKIPILFYKYLCGECFQ